MYLKNRTCGEYLSGLKTFILVAEADKSNQNKSVICCPCVDCENVTEFSSSMHVHAHLIIRGFMDAINAGTGMVNKVLMLETLKTVVRVKEYLPINKLIIRMLVRMAVMMAVRMVVRLSGMIVRMT